MSDDAIKVVDHPGVPAVVFKCAVCKSEILVLSTTLSKTQEQLDRPVLMTLYLPPAVVVSCRKCSGMAAQTSEEVLALWRPPSNSVN